MPSGSDQSRPPSPASPNGNSGAPLHRRIAQQVEGLVEDDPQAEPVSSASISPQSPAYQRIAQQVDGLADAPRETVCKWCKGGECTGACRD